LLSGTNLLRARRDIGIRSEMKNAVQGRELTMNGALVTR
jgi:hypothetical protein